MARLGVPQREYQLETNFQFRLSCQTRLLGAHHRADKGLARGHSFFTNVQDSLELAATASLSLSENSRINSHRSKGTGCHLSIDIFAVSSILFACGTLQCSLSVSSFSAAKLPQPLALVTLWNA